MPDFTPEGFARAHENVMTKFDAIHRLCNELAPERCELATTAADVRRIKAAGKSAILIGVENGYSMGEDIRNVEKFYNLGARYMSLAHNGHSHLVDSHTGERDGEFPHNGLSPLGRQVIQEMNRLGMMVDISHPSKEGNRQTMELSRAPVIASHSSARALASSSRNLEDDELRAVAATGGDLQNLRYPFSHSSLHTNRYCVFGNRWRCADGGIQLICQGSAARLAGARRCHRAAARGI